jgi:hypothetical protein
MPHTRGLTFVDCFALFFFREGMPSVPPSCLAENNEDQDRSAYSTEEVGDLDALT